MPGRNIFPNVLLLCLLLLPISAGAAAINVVLESNATYAVKYTDFDSVGGVQVIIHYDPLTTNVQGLDRGPAIDSAKAQFSAYDNKNGTMNFAAITTVGFDRTSGVLARVTFGGSAPRVSGSEANLTSISARPMPKPTVQVIQPEVTVVKKDPTPTLDTPGVKPAPTATTVNQPPPAPPSTPLSTATAVGAFISGGSVALPTDPLATPAPTGPTDKTIELEMVASEPQQSSDSTQTKPADVKPVEKKNIAYPGIAQRFKDFTDEITPAAMIGLFVDPLDEAVKQVPPIVYADGISTFKVSVDSKILTSTSPSMLLRGAKLVELGTDGDLWVVAVKTLEKGLDGQLQILDSDKTVDVPLTIVPKIKLAKDKAGKVDAAEFVRVLADRGMGKNSKFDFNGDGKHDELDDYIYTANYIKQTGLKPTKPKAAPKAKSEPIKATEPEVEKGKAAAVKDGNEPAKSAPGKLLEKKKKKK